MKKKRASEKGGVIIYQGKSGAIELKGDFRRETIWATQKQIADLFNVDRTVITKHIKNIFKDTELKKKSVCAIFAHTANDGKIYNVEFYNLDVILSVGYRANSKRAIEFRKWATKILREHITKGFTINRAVIKNNYAEFQKAIENVRQLLPAGLNTDNTSKTKLVWSR